MALGDMNNFVKDNIIIIGSIIGGIFIIGMIILIINIIKKNEKFENEQTTSTTSNKLVLKYFGSTGCPHSRKGSRAYNIIRSFEDEYNDVDVQYYWSHDESVADEFDKAKAEYVPTITNGEYKQVDLVLPTNIDKEDKSDEELREMLLSNVYKQLS
jgi:hypothetical protein